MPCKSVPILMYHRVTPDDLRMYSNPDSTLDGLIVPPDSFAKQMAWLSRWQYTTLLLDDLLSARVNQRTIPRRSVVITFDDGYQDVADYAVPVLLQHGFTAHIFLVAGLVGGSSEWDRDEHGWEFPLFDWNTARELEAKGFRCEAHSMTHQRLGTLNADECRAEIEECRNIMKQKIGRDIEHFAYPFGSYSNTTKTLVQQAGFRSACSVEAGLSQIHDDSYSLRRIGVHMSDSLVDFKCAVMTGRRLRRGMKRRLHRFFRFLRTGS